MAEAESRMRRQLPRAVLSVVDGQSCCWTEGPFCRADVASPAPTRMSWKLGLSRGSASSSAAARGRSSMEASSSSTMSYGSGLPAWYSNLGAAAAWGNHKPGVANQIFTQWAGLGMHDKPAASMSTARVLIGRSVVVEAAAVYKSGSLWGISASAISAWTVFWQLH